MPRRVTGETDPPRIEVPIPMRRRRPRPLRTILTALLVASFLAIGLPIGSAQAAPDPVTCSGYPQPRVFLEGQAWWTEGGQPDQHLHLGECFPLNQTVGGVLRLDLRLLKHNTLGRTTMLVISDELGNQCLRSVPVVPADQANTTTFVRVALDTTCFPDGYRDIVLRWTVKQPNGNMFTARQALPLNIENGTPDTNQIRNYVLGGGWYDEKNPVRGWEYAHAIVRAARGGNSAYSLAPRSGTFTLNVEGGRAVRGPETGKSFVATLDPDFHNGHAGMEVLRAAARYIGPLSIDTTRLTNGPHKLVLIECHEVAAEGKTFCGVVALPFTVSN